MFETSSRVQDMLLVKPPTLTLSINKSVMTASCAHDVGPRQRPLRPRHRLLSAALAPLQSRRLQPVL